MATFNFIHCIRIVLLLAIELGTAHAFETTALQHVERELQKTPHHVKLSKISRQETPLQPRSHSTVVDVLPNKIYYGVEVKFNGVPRYLRLDTGSSDTWMFEKDAKCLTVAGKPAPKSNCGTPYTGTVEPIKDVHFWQVYGDGEEIFGTFGYADVTVAGLSIKKQQVALADKAYYSGDGVASGLLGLASRLTTMEFPGSDQNRNNLSDVIRYSPVIESMFNETDVKPFFSLALERGLNGGYLAFSGLPPIDFKEDFVSTKFADINYYGKLYSRKYYPIKPDGYELAGTSVNSSYVGIVDSGTYACRFPTAMADKINGAFDPPAKYLAKDQIYIVPCNATAPKFGITIAGKTFDFHPSDMFLPTSVDNICATTITRGLEVGSKAYPDGFYILGDAFLHNVVAVFDIEHKMMRFAPHCNY